jgi:hypothetical protein
MKNHLKKYIILCTTIVILAVANIVVPVHIAHAELNFWGGPIDPNVGQTAFADFGNNDPRIMAGRLVQIFLGLLGVIAIVLIIYGGWLYMTAQGAPDKVEKARKVLTDAIIGLLIILSAFAIATYVISRLVNATGATSADTCVAGQTQDCGCGGVQTCVDTGWGACVGSDCGGGTGGNNVSCDKNALTPTCEADDVVCGANQYCDNTSCFCKPQGNVGDSCDGDTGTTGCQAKDSKCGQFLICDPTGCICDGPPLIEAFNPLDSAPGSLMTITGRYFGTYNAGSSHVYFWDGAGFNAEAQLAGDLNPLCGNTWFDREIIVVVPATAQSGPIRVSASNGQDDSNDTRGNNLADFVVNNVVRPGVCKLDPNFGKTDAVINYYGINLQGGSGYFGNIANNVAANTSNFGSALSGTATVPNIASGATTSFVLSGGGIASNFLRFVKTEDVINNLAIVGFDPVDGGPGQYVTIYGKGFGALKNDSKVYFGNVEASYEFPRVCATSVWSDNQLVVKVPELVPGDVQINMTVGTNTAASPTNFTVNDLVRPGLCKLDPKLGKANDEITLWGENFGKQSPDSSVIFYQNNIVSGAGLNFWGLDTSTSGVRPDKAITKIHVNALSGPVKVSNNGLESNALQLAVGACTADDQCGTSQVCCPAGTPEAGSCQANQEKCLGAFDSSVFVWDFNTGFSGNSCALTTPYKCGDGSCCKSPCVDDGSGTTVCGDGSACAALSPSQCLLGATCPNSPGACSVNPNKTLTAGSCDCNFLGCPAGANCTYDNTLNRCMAQAQCNLNVMINDVNGAPIEKFCENYQGTNRWQVKTNQTCPPNFTKAVGNNSLCVDVNSTCDTCSGNLSCMNIGNVDIGRCGLNRFVCPNNFDCNATTKTCERTDGSCECCCDKKQNSVVDQTNPGCCAPLTCDNSCGTGGDFGLCSGCAAVGSTQAEHDAACNCSGTAGKFCDTSVPGGVCGDCAQLSDLKACGAHDTCCVDGSRGNACRGATGGRYFDSLDRLVYCSYFTCDSCQVPDKTGDFTSRDRCETDCPLSCNQNVGGGVCSPDDTVCKAVSANLECNPDTCICESNVIDDNKCGCSLDADCNNLNQGCGYDGCCAARPKVVEHVPALNQTGSCRNTMIRAKFDQLMNPGSLDNNVLLIADYGNDSCPTGTQLLVRADHNLFLALLARPVFAAANYCAVSGRVLNANVKNITDGYSLVDFAPNQALDANRKYYVVIKGDARLDSTSGAMSDASIGLRGENHSDAYVFNGIIEGTTNVSYPNAEIWSFTTGNDLCQMDRVAITPDQYLFQQPNQVYDSFLATVYSASDEPIVSSADYAWNWSWSSENENIAKIEQSISNPDQAIATGGSKDNTHTMIHAKATIARDVVNTNSTVGASEEGQAMITLFFCQNPWPQLNDLTAWPFRWRDAADNCDIYPAVQGTSACIDNHFEFYYCRDQGDKNTPDDLPAFTADAVVRARDDNAPKPLLKEMYFFREKLPQSPQITGIKNSNQPNGGSVDISWSAIGSAVNYKVYYGTTSGKYSDYLVVSGANSLQLTKLRNQTDYYFVVTVVDSKGVESRYSEEKNIQVADIVAPAKPTNVTAFVDVTGAVKSIDLTWKLETADVNSYEVDYGPNQVPAAKTNIGLLSAYQILGVDNINTQDYYVDIKALDAYDNISDPVKFRCAASCANRCSCIVL